MSSGRVELAKFTLERCRISPPELWPDTRQLRDNSGLSDMLMPSLQNARTLELHCISSTEELAQTLQEDAKSPVVVNLYTSD